MDIGTLTGQIEIEDQLSGALSSLTTNLKEFALSFDGIFGSLALGTVGVVAGITAISGAIIALGTRGADVNDLSATLDNFSGSAAASAEILEKMKEGTLGVITNFDLMKSSSKLLAGGVKLNADGFQTLASAASVLSNQGLGPTGKMLDLVSNAMLRGNTRALEMAVGKIDLKAAEEKYAASLGTVRKDLTALEQVEARRMAILDALNERVKAAGVNNRDFGETMQMVVANVKDWFDKLAGIVAKSPAVQAALDAIGAAFTRVFGGTSENLINSVAEAIDDFARAVAATVPYIADFLRIIGATIGKIWEYRDAIMAIVAGFIAYKLIIVSATALTWLMALGFDGVVVAAYLAATAVGTFLAAALPITAVVVGLAAGLTTAYNAFMLWREGNEQAASAARNASKEAENLATINSRLGTSYKTIEEGQAETYRRSKLQTGANKEAAAAAATVAEETKRVGKLQEQAAGQAEQLSDQLLNGAKELRITEGVLKSYNSAQLQNYGVLERVVPKIMELVAAHIPLNATLREAHANYVAQTLAQNADGVEKLKAHGITLGMIIVNQKLGITLKDIAFFYTVTEAAVTQYIEELKKEEAATTAFANVNKSLAIGMEIVTAKVDLMTKAIIDNATAADNARVALREWREDMSDFTEIEKAIRNINRQMEDSLKKLDFRTDPMGAAQAAIPIVQKRDEQIAKLYSDEDLAQSILFMNITTEASQKVKELNRSAKTAALDGLANFFVMMGQISGDGGMGKFMKALGGMAIGLKSANDWATQKGGISNEEIGGRFGALSAVFSKGTTNAQKWAAGMQAAAGIASGVMSIWAATNQSASKAQNALSGAMAGAQAGAMFGPWGIAIGAAAGLVTGLVRGKPAWAAAASEVARDFGVKISDELSKTIAANAKKSFGGNRQAAALDSLASIIKEGGGVNAGNVAGYTSKLHDVFSMLETGAMTSAQAVKVLDENFDSLVKDNTDSLGFWSNSLKDIIALNDRFGTQSKAIADAVKAQAVGIVASFNMIMVGTTGARKGYADLKKAVDDATVEIKKLNDEAVSGRGADWAQKMREAQDKLTAALERQHIAAESQERELADLGTIAVAAFAIAIAKGATFAEALAAAQPGISALRHSYEDLGMSIEDPFLKMLAIQSSIMENNPTLIQGASGLAGALAGMTNLNMLNADTFAAMGRVAADTYTRIQNEVAKVGGSTRDALLPMQDYLHAAAKAAKALNLPLDEHTQMMIQQSEDLGIWKDEGPTAAEAMQAATEKLTTAIENLTKMLGGIPTELPNPFERWRIPVSKDDVDGLLNRDGYRSPNDDRVGFDRGGQAGLDYRPPSSRDVIPALLRRGERVLTPELAAIPTMHGMPILNNQIDSRVEETTENFYFITVPKGDANESTDALVARIAPRLPHHFAKSGRARNGLKQVLGVK